MKSALEQTLLAKRARAERVVTAEHGDGVLDALYCFSDLDCIMDVKLEHGWVRYVLIEGDLDGDGSDDAMRRIA